MRDQFFIIDSNNMHEVTSRMYGYAITDDKIFDNIHEFDEQKHKNSSGSFIAIKRDDDVIKFYQDNIGSYGIFVYKEEDYFAVSNSFILLYEYLLFEKHKKLDVNFEYIAHFLEDGFASLAFTATLCEQINLIPSKTKFKINIDSNTLNFEFFDVSHYGTIDIDSNEGQSIIESWINKWTSIIKSAVDKKYYISSDLSGGFDSRLTLSLFLASGVDLAKINFNARSPAHAPLDFETAQQLSQTFNFQLNNIKYPSKTMSHADSWNIALLTRFGAHAETNFAHDLTQITDNIQLNFTGFGGEVIRSTWFSPVEELEVMQRNSQKLDARVKGLTRQFLRKELSKVWALSNQQGLDKKDDGSLLNLFYNETRLRHHFGVGNVGRKFFNKLVLSPLCDEELKKLNLKPYEGKERNILVALIFTKLNKQLIDIPLNGKYLDKDCVNKAIKMNSSRSYAINTRDYHISLQPHDFKYYEEFNANDQHPHERLKEVFYNLKTKGLLDAYFGKSLYLFFKEIINFEDKIPNRAAFLVFTIVKMLNYQSSAFIPNKLFYKNKKLVELFTPSLIDQSMDDNQSLAVNGILNSHTNDTTFDINHYIQPAKISMSSLDHWSKDDILPCLTKSELTRYNDAESLLSKRLNFVSKMCHYIEEPCVPDVGLMPFWMRALKRISRQRAELLYLRRTGCFDASFYLKCNPDVLNSGVDPLWHYIFYGASEGRNPAPWFDTKKYVAKNPDIVASKLNPFCHYIIWGRREERVAYFVDMFIDDN